MSESRRAEIAAKRERLAELRRAREERAERERTGAREHRPDIHALVAELVGEGQGKGDVNAQAQAAPTQAAPAEAPPAEAPPAEAPPTQPPPAEAPPTQAPPTQAPPAEAPPAPAPVQGQAQAPPAPAPPPEKVLYTKEVQTEPEAPEEAHEAPPAPAPAPEEAPVPAPSSPTPAPAPPSPSTYTAFLSQSTRIVERALDEPYDILTDYTHVPAAGARDESALRHAATLHTAALDGRAVAALDWSTKHPELLVAGYTRARTPLAADDYDGIAAVWNVHAPQRPEFTFRAPTDVLAVLASPFHPHLFVGGTYSGQVLLWDTRHRGTPVQRSPLAFAPGAAQGHAAPVYSLALPGTASAHELVSASTDGTVCTWALDMLGRPLDVLTLTNPQHPRSPDVSIAALGVLPHDTQRMCIGTTEGNIFAAQRTDRAGARAGLALDHVYVGHSAPVTRVAFHPAGAHAPLDLGDLFLSSSMDWSSALWRVGGGASSTPAPFHYPHADARIATSTRTNPLAFRAGTAAWTPHAPLARFESELDYVMDVQWHPTHPALFAHVDAAGRLDVYNLARGAERPALRTQLPTGLNRVSWERADLPTRIASGAFDGCIHIHQLAEGVVRAQEGDWKAMGRWL